jgi:fructose-1,6-bisphosphatase I
VKLWGQTSEFGRVSSRETDDREDAMGATRSLEAVLTADAGGRLEAPLTAALTTLFSEFATAAIALSTLLAAPDEPDRPLALATTAADLFDAATRRSSVCCYLAAGEGAEAPLHLRGEGLLDVATVPLDGGADLDVGAPAATLFSIFAARRESARSVETAFLRPGREQIAAALVLYGPQTSLLLTAGAGAHLFQLHRESQTFVQVRSNWAMPRAEGDHQPSPPEAAWSASEPQASGVNGQSGGDRPVRPLSALAFESYRVLVRGGLVVRASSSTASEPSQHTRLLCEANPIALLARETGGAASDGLQPILDVVAEATDQRTAFLMGSPDQLERVRRDSLGSAPFASRPPLFGRRGLLRT